MAVAHGNVAGLLRKHGYAEIKKVGEGSFGKALLVRSEDGQKLICKMVDVSKASRKEMEDAVKEGKLLSELKHPYIVRYRESFTESGWLCILMDYCEGGDLTARIAEAKRGRKPLSEDQILRWFVQAIMALDYIHKKHVLHRDLKPSNFFLSKSGNLKMGDFGIAKVLACTIAVAKTQIGTPYYLSPELCQEKEYNFPSDIWAMGCILYELCARKVPFDAPNIPGLVREIVRGTIPSVPASYSPFVRELVSQMLNRNPERRPSPEEILAKPRLREIMQLMLDEAQEAAQAADDPAAVEPHPEPASSNSAGLSQAGSPYRTNDMVEYYSVSHGDWLPATVLRTDGEGRIIIDLKPNTWLSKEDQATKVRRRRDGPGSRGGSPMRTPSVAGPDKNGLRGAFPSPQMGRSPSSGAVGLRPGSRPGSRGASPLHRRSPALAAGAIAGIGSRPGSGLGSRPGSRAASPSHRAPSPRHGEAFRKGDLVDYWSISHGEWLPATVVNTDFEGRIVIDLKPNTWLTKEDQASKVRRRMVAGAPGAPEGSQIRHSPSADHFAAPLRAASPRCAPSPGRAMSPHRAPSPSWRGFGEPAMRAPSPRRREPTPRRSVPGMPPAGGPQMPHLGDSPLLRAGGKNIAGGYLPP
mmetsp:Transcript_59920/g.140169  ORF Transcript_59920/g.140169 Transcript_59920/m.140169 type:complete len:638 (+) Transcript_59920:66-1979(+)